MKAQINKTVVPNVCCITFWSNAWRIIRTWTHDLSPRRTNRGLFSYKYNIITMTTIDTFGILLILNFKGNVMFLIILTQFRSYINVMNLNFWETRLTVVAALAAVPLREFLVLFFISRPPKLVAELPPYHITSTSARKTFIICQTAIVGIM